MKFNAELSIIFLLYVLESLESKPTANLREYNSDN